MWASVHVGVVCRCMWACCEGEDYQFYYSLAEQYHHRSPLLKSKPLPALKTVATELAGFIQYNQPERTKENELREKWEK